MRTKTNDPIKKIPVGVSDWLAGKLSAGLQWLQTGFATKLNKAFGATQRKRLWVGVIVFFLVSGGYSLFLLTTAFNKSPRQIFLKVDAISRPKHFDKTGDAIQEDGSTVNEAALQKIQKFRKYMDSLKRHHVQQYDSLLFQRPMLMDSVRLWEEHHYSQKQNLQHEK